MNPSLDGLEKKQIQVLQQIGPLTQEHGFYLAGGTALTIYFNHRISVDLDWFTSSEFGDAMLLAQTLRQAAVDFTIEQVSPGALHGSLSNVRVTFLEYRYPLLNPPIGLAAIKCSLASLDDLACMKLSAIAQRGARKDFCDLYALGTQHRPLKEMLALYQQKFGVRDIGPVLYGLLYFDDAESERMPKMLWDISWNEIKEKIRAWVREQGQA